MTIGREDPETPAEADVIRAAIDARLRYVHTAIPAKVTRYDAAKQVCDAQPLIRREVPVGRDGETRFETLPIVPEVPVLFPSAGGFHLTFPLAVGDEVLLVFSERDYTAWFATGSLSDTVLSHTHHLADAFAIVGGFHRGAEVDGGPSSTDLVIGKDGGPYIRIKPDGTVHLSDGTTATDAASLASKVDAIIETFINASPGVQDGGAALQAAVSASWTAIGETVASPKVKID